jgi:hypothetical protein
MDSGLDPRLKLSHRSADVGETASNLYFELRSSQMLVRRDPSQNTARDQAQHDAVRVVDDDHIVDLEAQLRSGCPACLNCATEFQRLHTVLPHFRAHEGPGSRVVERIIGHNRFDELSVRAAGEAYENRWNNTGHLFTGSAPARPPHRPWPSRQSGRYAKGGPTQLPIG